MAHKKNDLSYSEGGSNGIDRQSSMSSSNPNPWAVNLKKYANLSFDNDISLSMYIYTISIYDVDYHFEIKFYLQHQHQNHHPKIHMDILLIIRNKIHPKQNQRDQNDQKLPNNEQVQNK